MLKRILLINPFGIGDVLFSTPLIRNLRFYYPDAFIAVMVQKKVAPILENNPHINKIIPFSRGDFKELARSSRLKAIRVFLRVYREILAHRFNLCFDLSLEHRYSLFLKLAGVKPRIGYNYKNRGRFLTHRIDIEGYEKKHVVEYHLELLRFLGKEPRFRNQELYLKQEERDWADAFLRQNGVAGGQIIVGIIPGGGESWGDKADYLRWPSGNFSKVCNELSKTFRAKIFILGAKSDIQVCRQVVQNLKQKPIEAFGRTNLRQFIALLDKCSLIICNDTGPLHLSTALGKKIIYFSGPVDEKVYGAYPTAAERIVMKKDLPCRPCYRKFHLSECRYERRCLTEITVDEVLGEAMRLIRR